MFIKTIITVFIIFSCLTSVYSKEIPVEIKSNKKISTANLDLQEGDSINFVINKDVYINSKLYISAQTPASGIITSLIPNGFTCQEASIYVENFKTHNVKNEAVKLNGIVYKKGRTHWMLTQFLPVVYHAIRGGEAFILPNHTYTLYLEDKND